MVVLNRPILGWSKVIGHMIIWTTTILTRVSAKGTVQGITNVMMDKKDEGAKSAFLNRKVGRLTVGEIIFIVLGILTLMSFVNVAVLCILGDLEDPKRLFQEVFTKFDVPDSITNLIVFLTMFVGFASSLAFAFYCFYLCHIDRGLDVCQKVCLGLGMLLFVALLVVVLLEVYIRLLNCSDKKKEMTKPNLKATMIMTSLSLILFIAFQAAVYRQNTMCKPYCNRQKIFIGLSVVVTVLMLVILATKTYFCVNGCEEQSNVKLSTSSAALVMVCFPAVIAILWLSCDLDFIGHQFTPMEIAFGVLSILVFQTLILEIVFALYGKKQTEHHYAPPILLVIAMVFAIPWIYCAYHLNVFDAMFATKEEITPEKVEPKEYPYGKRVLQKNLEGSEELSHGIRT
ncbi:hypothetical protein BaOVIS_029920 [Babesia ovis]|uniref:Uncharacterized protein n=1 Tax=Babesia ovis TaxID=5869 RepID=A0A9W5WW37_BABOV|nr:hypothetical protein BaOVIS_029920 [Babesia ovis]